MLVLILLVFAFVLALVQSFAPWRGGPFPPHLGWLAVALYFLTLILGHGAFR